jgi:hypothetical protein
MLILILQFRNQKLFKEKKLKIEKLKEKINQMLFFAVVFIQIEKIVYNNDRYLMSL